MHAGKNYEFLLFRTIRRFLSSKEIIIKNYKEKFSL
jgi:hypothetical protein